MINSETINLYWEIGEEIYRQQQENGQGKSIVQAKLAVKDEYTFDFAELLPEYSEHELEMQLVNNVKAFLIEMGGDFTFVGNQYHMVVGSRDLYIDLLLFHRRLRGLVAIELKIGEFEAEYAGKMQLHLKALDEQVKLPDIGIINL